MRPQVPAPGPAKHQGSYQDHGRQRGIVSGETGFGGWVAVAAMVHGGKVAGVAWW